jgi:CheY-like chemotaxis protein
MDSHVFATTILVIDDDQDDVELFVDAVKEINSSVICEYAYNASDALVMLETAEPLPDIIFLDLVMPKMDGKTLLLKLRDDRKLIEIPVIMVSTNFSDDEMEYYSSLRVKCLLKPNSYETFVVELRRVLAEFLPDRFSEQIN